MVEYVKTYLHHIRFEKRYSPATLVAYQTDLNQFCAYLSDNYEAVVLLQDINLHHLRGWLTELRLARLSERTLNRKIAAVHAFFKFLNQQKLISKDPSRHLQSLKVSRRLPKALRAEETENLLEKIEFPEGFEGLTHRLILEVLYQTGMRRAELIGLKENQIDWTGRQIAVWGKGSKERLVPVSEQLLQLLKHYRNERSLYTNPLSPGYFFIQEKGTPLYPNYVHRVVRKYISIVSSLKQKSAHVLRHSFATQLLENGANIQAIKDLLGHSSLAATQVYTHNQIEKLKEIHKLNHPRG